MERNERAKVALSEAEEIVNRLVKQFASTRAPLNTDEWELDVKPTAEKIFLLFFLDAHREFQTRMKELGLDESDKDIYAANRMFVHVVERSMKIALHAIMQRLH